MTYLLLFLHLVLGEGRVEGWGNKIIIINLFWGRGIGDALEISINPRNLYGLEE